MSARAAGVALVRLAEHPAGKAGHFTAVHAAVFVAMAWLSDDRGQAPPLCRVALAELAATALCDRATAARVVAHLERHGVIVRGQHGPRQRVPWTLTPLTKERPVYEQSAYSASRQGAYSDDAERLHGVGRARHGSIPVPSADVGPDAAAPLPPPPDRSRAVLRGFALEFGTPEWWDAVTDDMCDVALDFTDDDDEDEARELAAFPGLGPVARRAYMVDISKHWHTLNDGAVS